MNEPTNQENQNKSSFSIFANCWLSFDKIFNILELYIYTFSCFKLADKMSYDVSNSNWWNKIEQNVCFLLFLIKFFVRNGVYLFRSCRDSPIIIELKQNKNPNIKKFARKAKHRKNIAKIATNIKHKMLYELRYGGHSPLKTAINYGSSNTIAIYC